MKAKKILDSKLFLLIAFILGLAVVTKIYFILLLDKQIVPLSILDKNNSTGKSKFLIYTKNGCPYCVYAKNLLDERKIQYEMIDISHNQDLQAKLYLQTGQTTVPYIFKNEKFLGGYEDLKISFTE